jgi:hypothetical protein
VVRVILEETIDIEMRLRLVSTAKNVEVETSPTSCTICWSFWDETFALRVLYSLGRIHLEDMQVEVERQEMTTMWILYGVAVWEFSVSLFV